MPILCPARKRATGQLKSVVWFHISPPIVFPSRPSRDRWRAWTSIATMMTTILERWKWDLGCQSACTKLAHFLARQNIHII